MGYLLVFRLRKHLTSAIALILVVLLFCGCAAQQEKRNAVAEVNTLSSGNYHITLIGQSSTVTLAYKTDVLHIDDCAQWNGIATVGAYSMAFQQDCRSLYTTQYRAKQWRGKWVESTATSPKEQIDLWLQEIQDGAGTMNTKAVDAAQLLPLEEGDACSVFTARLENASLNWEALTDVHLDSMFGSQAFLTDVETGTVTLCFNTEDYTLVGVIISAKNSQTTISCTITVSTVEGQTIEEIPNQDSIGTGTLSEEWTILEP